MNKPSFAVGYDKDNNPVLLAASHDADVCIQAYKAHEGAASLFIRPSADKSKGEASGLVFKTETIKAAEVKPVAVESSDDIEALKLAASGDKRKASVKEAQAKLAELGVEY